MCVYMCVCVCVVCVVYVCMYDVCVCVHAHTHIHIHILKFHHLPLTVGYSALIDVVEGRSFIRPVAVTLFDTVLHQRGQHNDDSAATLPHHLRTEIQVSGPLRSLALAGFRGLRKTPLQACTCQKSAMVWDSGPCVAM